MAGGFRLCEFQDLFQVRDAHFPVGQDEVKNPEARRVRAGEEYLRARFNIKMFQPHYTNGNSGSKIRKRGKELNAETTEIQRNAHGGHRGSLFVTGQSGGS